MEDGVRQASDHTDKKTELLRSFEKVAYNYVYETISDCNILIIPKS